MASSATDSQIARALWCPVVNAFFMLMCCLLHCSMARLCSGIPVFQFSASGHAAGWNSPWSVAKDVVFSVAGPARRRALVDSCLVVVGDGGDAHAVLDGGAGCPGQDESELLVALVPVVVPDADGDGPAGLAGQEVRVPDAAS